jgi:hypothetical protein
MYVRVLLATILIASGLCVHGHAAQASCRVVTFSQQGVWRAYGGPCDDGTSMCGVSTSGTGKFFGLKYFKGDDTVTIQLGSGDWSIKNGAKQSVTMQIDSYDEWNATATGFHFEDRDAGLEYQIRQKQLDEFVREFRDGDHLVIDFPGAQGVEGWSASLDGSDKITDSFLNCIKAM